MDIPEGFTPGPWRVFYGTEVKVVLGVGDAEGGGITDCGFGLWRSEGERDANARLIALAPDMAAEIVRLRALLDMTTEPKGGAKIRRWRKKPDVIEAVQWTGSNLAEIVDFGAPAVAADKQRRLVIRTLEGDMTARPGDWIIRTPVGDFYPCKPDIFAATYELVTEARDGD